jgi:septal ring factor EnvC (AmiA/AmiB activator)
VNFLVEKPMAMDADYEDPLAETTSAMPADRWDDPAIGAYLEQSREAERDRINTELAHIEDELAARNTLHADLVTELEWQIEKYERELDRLTKPIATSSEDHERVSARLRSLRQELRNEHRQHWQDRQHLVRERRELRRDRARLADEDISQFL